MGQDGPRQEWTTQSPSKAGPPMGYIYPILALERIYAEMKVLMDLKKMMSLGSEASR
nr:hypothetical protein [Tanacetum cinerariifolium]